MAMLKNIVALARTGLNVLHAALLAVFLGMMAMVVAVYFGAGWPAALAAGGVGLTAGAILARRVWFGDRQPAPEPAPAERRCPGVQDEFERLHARQRVLALLLILEVIALAALRFALERDYPTLWGIPRDRLLAWVLLSAAVTLALGLLNWRCPNCRRNLGRSLSVSQCQRCGIVLKDRG
jgi:hypothetical protein